MKYTGKRLALSDFESSSVETLDERFNVCMSSVIRGKCDSLRWSELVLGTCFGVLFGAVRAMC